MSFSQRHEGGGIVICDPIWEFWRLRIRVSEELRSQGQWMCGYCVNPGCETRAQCYFLHHNHLLQVSPGPDPSTSAFLQLHRVPPPGDSVRIWVISLAILLPSGEPLFSQNGNELFSLLNDYKVIQAHWRKCRKL